jgi:hypothetical protein
MTNDGKKPHAYVHNHGPSLTVEEAVVEDRKRRERAKAIPGSKDFGIGPDQAAASPGKPASAQARNASS